MSMDEFDYCDDMNEEMSLFEVPALKSPRQQIGTVLTDRGQEYNYKESKASWSKISENIDRYYEKKQRKIDEIKAELQTKTMQQCTFKPRTNKSSKKNNLNQFLKRQNEHTNRIEQKKSNLKKKIQEKEKKQQSFQPKINERKTKQTKSAYQRLYATKKTEVQQENIPTPSISPKPRKRRNNAKVVPVQELLYQDAVRRSGKQKSQVINQKQPHRNHKNEKIVAQKFIKEYYYALEDLGFLNRKGEMSFDQFRVILNQLGFAGAEENQNGIGEQQKLLVQEGFYIITQFKVNIRNICVFLMALIGVYNINPINFTSEEKDQNEDEDFEIDEISGRKLQHHFDLLFRNRLSNEAKLKKSSYSPKPQGKHHPTINNNSRQMAEKYRDRMVAKANLRFEASNVDIHLPDKKLLTHEDLLVIDSLGKTLQMSKIREEKLNKVDEECTFHPHINEPKITMQSNSISGIDKCKELYQYAKMKQQSKKIQESIKKNTKEERCEEKTEKRKFEKKSFVKPQQIMDKFNSLDHIKNVDKTLARMYEGRRLKNQKDEFLSRGEPNYCSTNRSSKAFSKQVPKPHIPTEQSELKGPQESLAIQNDPNIIVDINIGSEVHQIELYDGDQKNIKKIVDNFCSQNQLEEQSQKQLLEIVEKEITQYMAGKSSV